MSDFGKAPIKGEGMAVDYGDNAPTPTRPRVNTTYVERRVPDHLEDAAHEALDAFLRQHGYDPETL